MWYLGLWLSYFQLMLWVCSSWTLIKRQGGNWLPWRETIHRITPWCASTAMTGQMCARRRTSPRTLWYTFTGMGATGSSTVMPWTKMCWCAPFDCKWVWVSVRVWVSVHGLVSGCGSVFVGWCQSVCQCLWGSVRVCVSVCGSVSWCGSVFVGWGQGVGQCLCISVRVWVSVGWCQGVGQCLWVGVRVWVSVCEVVSGHGSVFVGWYQGVGQCLWGGVRAWVSVCGLVSGCGEVFVCQCQGCVSVCGSCQGVGQCLWAAIKGNLNQRCKQAWKHTVCAKRTICRLCMVLLSIFMHQKYFFFFFQIPNLSSSECCHVCLLFTNKVQKRKEKRKKKKKIDCGRNVHFCNCSLFHSYQSGACYFLSVCFL